MQRRWLQEKVVLLPEADILRKLSRLVSYKITQLDLLNTAIHSPENWSRMERLIFKENIYAQSFNNHLIQNSFEKAMLNYYELLEKILLDGLEKMKGDMKKIIHMNRLKQNLKLRELKNSNPDHN